MTFCSSYTTNAFTYMYDSATSADQNYYTLRRDSSFNCLLRTGYKIKDDRKFLGTFIMSFNALVT